jgi:hypothetical protein
LSQTVFIHSIYKIGKRPEQATHFPLFLITI